MEIKKSMETMKIEERATHVGAWLGSVECSLDEVRDLTSKIRRLTNEVHKEEWGVDSWAEEAPDLLAELKGRLQELAAFVETVESEIIIP